LLHEHIPDERRLEIVRTQDGMESGAPICAPAAALER
jgi:hypothetical protein